MHVSQGMQVQKNGGQRRCLVAALRECVVRAGPGTRQSWQATQATQDLEERLLGPQARGGPYL